MNASSRHPRRLQVAAGDLVFVPGIGHRIVESGPNAWGFFRVVGHSPIHVDMAGLQNLGKARIPASDTNANPHGFRPAKGSRALRFLGDE